MANRFVLKQFAGSATNNGAFGAAQATGAGVQPVANIEDVQSLAAFGQGWNSATLTADKLPPLEEIQGLEALLCKAIKEIYSEGIPFWINGETYYQDSRAVFNGKVYRNKTGSYTANNPATDTANWELDKPDTAGTADKLGTSTVGNETTPIYLNSGLATPCKQTAITIYDNTKTYYEEEVVLTIGSDDKVALYKSLADNNTSALTDDTKWENVSLGGTALPLLIHFWSDHEINDMPFLRADTFSWQDGTVYSNAYNHLVDDIDGITASTETVGGYTVTYYQATDGHKIVLADQETTVGNIYTATGVAWYYVLDTANTRFKLPRVNPSRKELMQIAPVVGNGMAVGLTNGSSYGGLYSNDSSAGALGSRAGMYGTPVSTTVSPSGAALNGCIGVTTDATKSGIEADLTQAITIYSGNKYLYFYVGQYTQSATEQTAGLNAELFNGKVDLNLSNVNNTGNAAANSLNSAGIRTVVDEWHSGIYWYRVWSDGWIEQGQSDIVVNTGGTPFNFFKAFKDSNYTIVVAATKTGSAQATFTTCLFNKSSTGATISGGAAGTIVSFYACGY